MTTVDPASIDQILLRQRIELRYRLDAAGRLVGENLPEDPDDQNAPSLYACLGADRLVYAFRHDVSPERVEHATAVLEALSDALFESPEQLADAAEALAATWGDGAARTSGPIYRVPRGLPQDPDVVLLDAARRHTLADSFPHTRRHLLALVPCAARLVDGKAVSICRTIRRSRFALEAGVDTLEAHRGRGTGAAVVAAWAEQAWREGRVPCYSTEWTNGASMALAHRLHMIPVGAEFTIGSSRGGTNASPGLGWPGRRR